MPTGPDVGVGIKLLDAPVNRRKDSRALHSIVDHVKPGTTFRRRVVVRNPSEVTGTFTVYPAAAGVDSSGFTIAPDGTPNELSSWITVKPTELRLAPATEAPVWVTIAVPEKASAGERYAVVWGQTVPNPRLSPSVHNVTRAGIRVYLSVGPGGEPPADFQISGIAGHRDKDGTPIVTATVRNTGQRALDLGGELRLSGGPGGLTTDPVKISGATLALEVTQTVVVRLDRLLPDGPWTVRLDLASGWTKRSATTRIDFSGRPVVGAAWRTPALYGGLGGSALILTALFGYTLYRRSGRERH